MDAEEEALTAQLREHDFKLGQLRELLHQNLARFVQDPREERKKRVETLMADYGHAVNARKATRQELDKHQRRARKRRAELLDETWERG
jgi:hypothetical protein